MSSILNFIKIQCNNGGGIMKYPYYFEYIVDTLTLRLPKEIDMFSDFIELIATEDEVNEFVQIIDEVKEGKHDQYEILFDAPMVTIQPEITSVTLSEVLDDPPPDQFRELILIWKEKLLVRFIDEDIKH